MTKPVSAIEARHSLGLRVIAIYKAIKTVCLIFVAIVAFRLHQQENFERLVGVLQEWGPSKFIAVGIVSLAYAAIFATEGTGLWLRKHWAEWFTVIATGSLIPVEAYEVFVRFNWLKVAALIGNIVIVVYLVRIAMQPHARQAAHTS